MSKNTKKWHKNFLEYMQMIVKHPNYKGMPHLYKKDGSVRWVVTGKSVAGKDRSEWWDKKRKQLNVPKEGPWISKTARAIHPTGEKPCQICGKYMKLDYVYPNKRGGMSPGAMSNAPDRLDGYHSYNQCCRGKHDTGRHKSNLSRYGEDRRVYENWSDGDWKASSWLMKVFTKHGVSPDHIGPISLGFAHRPKFNPMTKALNSAKNNRMSFEDVKILLQDEKDGEVVVSEHSKAIWNKIKNDVVDDKTALLLSKIMRKNLHSILTVFYDIYKNGGEEFLLKNFLHPEYAQYSIKFIGFNPKNGTYKEMVKTLGDKKQYRNNAKRYIRKSFDVLNNYAKVSNRNTKVLQTEEVSANLNELIKNLIKKDYVKARRNLDKIFDEMATFYYEEFLQTQK
jgi:hypothetical protein